jgi:STIP1 family protein 1
MQIPDYFCCKITLDLMEDPVVTDSGQTYERSVIEEHIERNGKTDPLTREPITGKLYPNLALKRAIQSFIDK